MVSSGHRRSLATCARVAKHGVALSPELAVRLSSNSPNTSTAAKTGHPTDKLGLPEGWVLPIHLFVDVAGKPRCVRMGGVGPEDCPGVEAVIAAIGSGKDP